jgi:serine/threonine protein kinase
MAPESIATRTYSKKSDIWSFGIVGLCIFNFYFIWQSHAIFFVWWVVHQMISFIRSLWIEWIVLVFCVLCFVFCVFNKFNILLIWLFELNTVYEIVAQCEPYKDENVLEVAVSIRWVNQKLHSTKTSHQTIDFVSIDWIIPKCTHLCLTLSLSLIYFI